jgi:hypothetical protein
MLTDAYILHLNINSLEINFRAMKLETWGILTLFGYLTKQSYILSVLTFRLDII